jgi:hypothetical protein
MSFAIALTVHTVSLRATKRRESTDRRPGGWGPRRICSPAADILAAGVPAGPQPDLDSGALFAWSDTGDRDRGASGDVATLVRDGYALKGLVSLDAQLDLDRPAYFAAIRQAIGQEYLPNYDATPFVAYFVKSIARSADHVLARIRGLGEVMVEIRRTIAVGRLPPAMIDGLAFAWVNRHMRAADYVRLSGRSPQTTTRDLATAVESGWLIATGEKRGRYYVLGPRLLAIPSQGEIVSPAS